VESTTTNILQRSQVLLMVYYVVLPLPLPLGVYHSNS